MPKLSRRRVIELTGAAGIAGLAGCTGGNGGGGSGRTIQIGTLLPASGKFSGIGKTMEDAARLAFQNAEEGTDQLSIEAQYSDSQSDPGRAITAANGLANAGVPAVVGAAITTNFLQTAQQVFIPASITMCSPSATAVSITNLNDKDLAFRTTPSDALQGRVMAKYANNEIGAQTAATLAINDAYGQGLANQFSQSWNNVDGTVQARVSYSAGQASYTSRISQAVENDPDMLVLVAKGGASSIQLLKDYYSEFDPDLPIMTVDGMNTARIPNEVGRPLENIVGTAPLANGPARDTFNQMYKDQFDQTPGPFNGQTFDAAAVELLANARAGENSGSAIKKEMRPVANKGSDKMTVTPDNLAEGIKAAADGDAVNYQGAASPVQFDENGDLVAGTFGIWEYAPDKESGFTIIDRVALEG